MCLIGVLSERLLEELRLYWQRYRPVEWLFAGAGKDRPLSIAAAQKAYLRAKRRARIKKAGGIHTLRHYGKRLFMGSVLLKMPVFQNFL